MTTPSNGTGTGKGETMCWFCDEDRTREVVVITPEQAEDKRRIRRQIERDTEVTLDRRFLLKILGAILLIILLVVLGNRYL